MRALRAIVCVVVATVALAGCGLLHAGDSRRARRAAVTRTSRATAPAVGRAKQVAAVSDRDADQADGRSTAQAPQLPSSAASATPQATLTRFAKLYINWAASELPERSQQLAAISVGQAHALALQFGRRTQTLTRYQVSNSGSVVALAAGQGKETGRWAVVTSEVTTGVGPYLGLPAISEVIWATVARQSSGYVVSGWYPTN